MGTITLLDSDGNPTSSFEIGENDNTAVLDNLIAGSYQIDFAQSPGEIIGEGATNAEGDARIPFDIPSTAHAGSATLTFLRGTTGATTTDRTLGITILAQATATAVPAAPVGTSTPTLPRTGAQIASFLLTAFALTALGIVLTLASRRRVAGAMADPSFTWLNGRTTAADLERGLRATGFGKLS